MFKYMPGMESGLGRMIEPLLGGLMKGHREPDGDEGPNNITTIFNMKEKEKTGMNDIAGLMALMNQNKGTDLAGMLNLAKNSGYDGQQWWWVIILLFLFCGGGWGNWGNGGQNKATATGLLGAEGLTALTSLYDRLAANQSATTQGFFNLDSKLCSSIAEVMASVRNQGDRVTGQMTSFQGLVQQCCCQLEATLARMGCQLDGISRDITQTGNLLGAKVDLGFERNGNRLDKLECNMNAGFNSVNAQLEKNKTDIICYLENSRKDEIIDIQRAKIAKLESEELAQRTANNAVNQALAVAFQHWRPTVTTTTPAATPTA